jgi:hypothetical protein
MLAIVNCRAARRTALACQRIFRLAALFLTVRTACAQRPNGVGSPLAVAQVMSKRFSEVSPEPG